MKSFLWVLCLIFFVIYQVLLPGIGQEINLFAQIPKGTAQHEKINMAQKLYFEGNFDLAIDLIKQCLQEGITADNEKVRAYKILAQAYLAKGFEQPAQEVVKKLLEIVPEYAPVIEEDPPQFVALVKKTKIASTVKTERPKPLNDKRSHWLWVGSAGAVILGATAILVLNGSTAHNTTKPLERPPAWPK